MFANRTNDPNASPVFHTCTASVRLVYTAIYAIIIIIIYNTHSKSTMIVIHYFYISRIMGKGEKKLKKI